MKSGKTVPSDTDVALNYAMAADYLLKIEPVVLRTLAHYRQEHVWQAEAGGQLFAEVSDRTIKIIHASEPKKRDRRSRFHFAPDRSTEQKEIDAQFQRGRHYVGDWHSHAEDVPSPSNTDIRSINECFRKSKHNLTGFLLLVVGRLQFPAGLYVGIANGKQLAELQPVLRK